MGTLIKLKGTGAPTLVISIIIKETQEVEIIYRMNRWDFLIERSGGVSSAIWLVIVVSVVQLNRVIAKCQTDVPGSRKNND